MIAGEREKERERERERESIVVPLMIAAGPNKAVREGWAVSVDWCKQFRGGDNYS